MKWQAFLLLSFFVAACTQQAAVPLPEPGEQVNQVPRIVTPEAKAFKIGFVAPLTGDNAVLGEPMRNGAQLAVEEINAGSAPGGFKLQLLAEDGQCNAKGATQAGNKLILTDKVPVIIGGACSSELLAIAPIAESNKVVAFSPSASSPDITVAGDFVFRSAASDVGQAKAAADHMKSQGHTKAAVIYANSDYNLGLKNAFESAFKAVGGEVAASETYEPDAKDFRTQITKIREKAPQAVLIIPYAEGGLIIKQLTELGVDAQFYGSETMASKDVLAAAGDAAEGLIYTTPKWDPQNPASAEFLQKYTAKFGREPDFASFAANAYDNVKLVAAALDGGASTPEQIRDYLYGVKDYPGAGGTLTIDDNGDAIKDFQVMAVAGGKFVKWEDETSSQPSTSPSESDNPPSDSTLSVSVDADAVKASFDPPPMNVFIMVRCFGPTEWKLYNKGSEGQWAETPTWYLDVSNCAARCENNKIFGGVCDGMCLPSASGCKRLERDVLQNNRFVWGKKLYFSREGSCEGKQGNYMFVEPAPKGEYRVTFTYYEDELCKTARTEEKTFELK